MQSQCHLLTVTKLIENESDSLKNVGKSTSNDHENINESVKLTESSVESFQGSGSGVQSWEHPVDDLRPALFLEMSCLPAVHM